MMNVILREFQEKIVVNVKKKTIFNASAYERMRMRADLFFRCAFSLALLRHENSFCKTPREPCLTM